MTRKTLIALAAFATVGAAALVPTAASAKHFGHGGWGHGWGHGFGWGRGIVVVGRTYDDCIRYVRVGYRTWRPVNICG